ncbi:MAG TPA: hypothetical protein VGK00_10910 [Anaerolineales bacterium]|jgi:hypothetical protein
MNWESTGVFGGLKAMIGKMKPGQMAKAPVGQPGKSRVKCEFCGELISSKAVLCIYCGKEVKKK